MVCAGPGAITSKPHTTTPNKKFTTKQPKKNNAMKTTAKTIGAILGILAASFALSNGCNAQNVQQDQQGNFHALSKQREIFTDSTTTKTYTDAKGKQFPVFVGAKGSYYVGRISGKTGKYYRQYLKE